MRAKALSGIELLTEERKEKKMEDVIREKCSGDHSGHLCVLVSQKRFDEVRELAKNPQYICFNCGRVAASDKNLCNPMPLEA